MSTVRLLGVVNCTPDSFSDGGKYASVDAAIRQAELLISAGAYAVDIGGDASGPGSVCTGPDEEWRRIAPVVSALANRCRVSVDTHHASTAQRAIDAGCWMVNDVSGGMDPAMLPVIGATSVLYACMYSCWDAPHQFGSGAGGDTVPAIRRFFAERVATLHAHGLTNEQIVLDPGMGAFLGTDSSVSLAVIDAIPQLCEIYSPLLIGVSRKRFLSSLVDTLVSDRDQRSALVARRIAHACPTDAMLYVRVHAIEPHVEQFLVDDSVNIEMS